MLFEVPVAAQQLGVALAIGLLIGLERGWHERELAEGARIAGIRTFGLIGLLGGVTATLEEDFGGWIAAAGLLAVAIAFGIAQWHDPRRGTDVSITTNIAALIAFGLGAVAGTGATLPAASAAIVTALLLSVKRELHHLVERIERTELLATLRLLLISVVVLPVLPDRGLGPWEALNPYRLWWMVVLVSGISYVGYFATRLVGTRRGVLLTGLLGGLASSTATVLSLSRQARDTAVAPSLVVSGMLAATAMMFPRTLLIATVIAPQTFALLALPLLSASVIAGAASALYAAHGGSPAVEVHPTETQHANPLDIKTAIKFTLVLAPVMLLARALKVWGGDTGLYLLSGISGLVDIDAIALSLATMTANAQTSTAVAQASILLATVVNTLVKPAIAFTVGGKAVGFRLLLPLVIAVAVIVVEAVVLR
jgi:uncharacterized membrane protein (DUF4010 family)